MVLPFGGATDLSSVIIWESSLSESVPLSVASGVLGHFRLDEVGADRRVEWNFGSRLVICSIAAFTAANMAFWSSSIFCGSHASMPPVIALVNASENAGEDIVVNVPWSGTYGPEEEIAV